MKFLLFTKKLPLTMYLFCKAFNDLTTISKQGVFARPVSGCW